MKNSNVTPRKVRYATYDVYRYKRRSLDFINYLNFRFDSTDRMRICIKYGIYYFQKTIDNSRGYTHTSFFISHLLLSLCAKQGKY